MNGIISKYGTFFVIPPVLAVIVVVAFTFKVTERREVMLVRSEPGIVCAYIPADLEVPDTVRVSAPETGELVLPVTGKVREGSYTKTLCKGNLSGKDSMVRAYAVTGKIPIARLLLKRNP